MELATKAHQDFAHTSTSTATATTKTKTKTKGALPPSPSHISIASSPSSSSSSPTSFSSSSPSSLSSSSSSSSFFSLSLSLSLSYYFSLFSSLMGSKAALVSPSRLCQWCVHLCPSSFISRLSNISVSGSRRSFFMSCLLLLLWMFASVASTLTNKTLMSVFPFPVSLSLIHLLSSVFADVLVIVVRGISIFPFRRDLFCECIPVALTINFGKTLTYVSYGMVPASLTHTAKASSPVFSVMMTKILYNKLPSARVLLSLVPITTGVILSAVTEIQFAPIGFIAAVLAALASVLNSLYTKQALEHTSCPDPLILHLYTCAVAVLMLLPYALIQDFRLIFDSQSYNTVPTSPTLTSQSSLSPDSLPIMHLLALSSPSPSLSSSHSDTSSSFLSFFSFSSSSSSSSTSSLSLVLWLMLFSVCMHYLQNISSVYYLSGVSVLTHQVAQTLKRLVVIASTVFWFGNPVTFMNGLGMGLAIFGFFLYGLMKKKDTHSHPHPHPPHQLAHSHSQSNLLELGQVHAHNDQNSNLSSTARRRAVDDSEVHKHVDHLAEILV